MDEKLLGSKISGGSSMNPLVGLWKLDSLLTRDENQHQEYPLGKDPIGYIQYLENGFMMMQMSKKDRPITDAHSPLDLKLNDELLTIVNSYNSYCGRYEIINDEVHHTIEACFFPNWSGKIMRRKFKLNDNFLTLSDEIKVNHKSYIFEARWQRQ